ncbi:hypothetical protein BMF35_a2212 [Aurantiacibacter gangjinensis]|nr:hypothetical protein BMF35_a2212 [Aurantiacibacter gangjinensis]
MPSVRAGLDWPALRSGRLRFATTPNQLFALRAKTLVRCERRSCRKSKRE